MKNTKGFTFLEVLFLIFLVMVLGGVGWYVWNAHNKTTDTFNNADSANSPVAGSSTSYLTVKDWGTKVPIEKGVSSLAYKITSEGYSFRTKALDVAKDAVCDSSHDNSVVIVRGKADAMFPSTSHGGNVINDKTFGQLNAEWAGLTSEVHVKIGDYYYLSFPPTSCGTGEGTSESEVQAQDALILALNHMVSN